MFITYSKQQITGKIPNGILDGLPGKQDRYWVMSAMSKSWCAQQAITAVMKVPPKNAAARSVYADKVVLSQKEKNSSCIQKARL